jgi:hypothetical protein
MAAFTCLRHVLACIGQQLTITHKVKIMHLYNLREIFVSPVDGKIKSNPLNPVEDGNYILVRYCEHKPTTDIPAFSFWTEFLAKDSKIASDGTGIPINECKWRIEWTFPKDNAAAYVIQLQKRSSVVGWFFEYNNIREVSLQHCKISKISN